MFVTKQMLGMVLAVFTGIVLLRVAERRSAFDCAMIVVGAACLFGSGLRGALALCSSLSTRLPRLLMATIGALGADATGRALSVTGTGLRRGRVVRRHLAAV